MGVVTGSGGTYNLSGGTIETGRYNIAEAGGSTGTVAITGGTLRQRDTSDIADGNQWNRIGQGGVATFNLSNGLVSLDSRTLVGADATSAGTTVTQTGGTFEVRRGEFVIGDGGTNATYNISGGTLRTLNAENGNTDTSGHLTIGQWDNSNGKLNVSGNATVLVAANLQLGNGQASAPSTGTVVQTGGIVRVGTAGSGDLRLADNAPAVASYTLQGGILDLTGGNIVKGAGTATFTMTGGELRDVRSSNIGITQGGGTLHPSDVEGGVATATINGNYTQSAGTANLLIDLSAAAGSDVLDVNGTATLAGTLSVNVLGDGVVPTGTQFTVLTPDTLVGAFTNGAFVTADTGQRFSISYTGGDGNDVVLTAQAVPEPGVMGGVLAAVGLASARRRVRRDR
jgi:hypothetical protein